MSSIIIYTTTADLDRLSVPSVIYTDTIAKNTIAIITYFENNPQLMLQFVGFNNALKRANQLNYEEKCGCFYKFLWNTQYNVVNSVSNTTLNFSQQVELYQYMLINWNNGQSYMHYLSAIALGILLKLKRAKYNITNGLCVCVSPLTTRTFANNYAFIQYLQENNINL